MGAVLLLVIFKQQLKELKMISYFFLAIVSTFVLLLFSELMTDEIRVRDTVNFDEITRVKADHHLLTAISIMIFAYAI